MFCVVDQKANTLDDQKDHAEWLREGQTSDYNTGPENKYYYKAIIYKNNIYAVENNTTVL